MASTYAEQPISTVKIKLVIQSKSEQTCTKCKNVKGLSLFREPLLQLDSDGSPGLHKYRKIEIILWNSFTHSAVAGGDVGGHRDLDSSGTWQRTFQFVS